MSEKKIWVAGQRAKSALLRLHGWMNSRGLPWLSYQLREMVGEIKRAARPPVKVRLQGRNVLSIAPRLEFGGGLVLLPLGGNGVVGVSAGQADGPQGRFTVEAWSQLAPEERVRHVIGTFPDETTAAYAVEIIRKPLTSGTAGKWVLRALLLWVILILVRTWLAQPAAPMGMADALASPTDTAEVAAPGNAPLMGLFGGSGDTGAGALMAAMSDREGAAPAGAESMADQIYNEAMAKAQASMREQGPPQSPAADTGLKGFGLGGGSGAGCDPKLAFKVSP